MEEHIYQSTRPIAHTHAQVDVDELRNKDILFVSDAQDMYNKRIARRIGTTASNAAPGVHTDIYDMYIITAQTTDITSMSTNITGTPQDGQTLWVSITGTASRAITWGAMFEASTVALPTTTSGTDRLDVGFVWNSATSKWRCVAVA